MDVLEPLDPFRDHPLYPKACGAVLAEKRTTGIHAALTQARSIAEAMGDVALEKRMR